MYLYRSLPRSSVIQGAHALVNVSATNAIADGNGVSQNQGYPNGSDHKTVQERVRMMEDGLLAITREIKKKPLPLPPPLSSHRDHKVQGSDSGGIMIQSSLAASQTPNTSTDHLYDSLDTPIEPDSPFYHTISSSNKASDSPGEGPIYHVLEGPPSGPVAAGASKYLSNTTKSQPPIPQKLAIVNRPRMNTCVTNPRVTQGSNITTGIPRSLSTSCRVPVSQQLSSVMSIYEVVPEDRSPSVLLPPKPIKSPVMPRQKEEAEKAEEVHIYHVLEVGSPTECQTGAPKQLPNQQQQTNNWKLKENSNSVSQIVRTESDGICNGSTESCKSKPVNLKRKPVGEMKEDSEYAVPNIHRQDTERTSQFDGQSHCSQPSATNKQSPLTTLSKTVKQPVDDVSYATPTTGGYTLSQLIFDDPQYDCSQTATPVQPERPTQIPIEFDDPKYQAPLSQKLSDTAAGTKSKRSLSTAHHHTSIPTKLFDDPKYASGFLQMSREGRRSSVDGMKRDHLPRGHVRPRSNSLFDDPKYELPESKIQLKQTLL